MGGACVLVVCVIVCRAQWRGPLCHTHRPACSFTRVLSHTRTPGNDANNLHFSPSPPPTHTNSDSGHPANDSVYPADLSATTWFRHIPEVEGGHRYRNSLKAPELAGA